jgi:hypothetical protein
LHKKGIAQGKGGGLKAVFKVEKILLRQKAIWIRIIEILKIRAKTIWIESKCLCLAIR